MKENIQTQSTPRGLGTRCHCTLDADVGPDLSLHQTWLPLGVLT